MSEPSHNLNALLIGTGEFSFSDGAEDVAGADLIGFRDYGNITAFQLQAEVSKLEHKGSYRGTLRKDRSIVTEQGVSYLLKCDEWDLRNLLILFGGEETTGFSQSAVTPTSAQTTAAWAFSSDDPAIIGNWYDIKQPSGARLRNLTTVHGMRVGNSVSCTADASTDTFTASAHGKSNGDPIMFSAATLPTGLSAGTVYYVINSATNTFKVSLEVGGTAVDISSAGTTVVFYEAMVEDTHFEVDLVLGRVRFIDEDGDPVTSNPITSSVQPVVTCDAIDAGDPLAFFALIPLQNITRSGMGRLVCFDQKDSNKVVFDHVDFECELSVENAAEINSSNWSEIQIRVSVKGQTPGQVLVRESFTADAPGD